MMVIEKQFHKGFFDFFQIYMFISEAKQIVGFCIAEKISQVFRLHPLFHYNPIWIYVCMIVYYRLIPLKSSEAVLGHVSDFPVNVLN